MKRLLALLLAALLLCGCSANAPGTETVRFFYRRSQLTYSGSRQNILAEERELSSRQNSLFYLLSLYLLGPTDEGLESPFPKGTMVLSVTAEGSGVRIILSEDAAKLSDSRFTLACACMSMTCMQQSAIRSVTICSGERELTMTAQDLTLFDYSTVQSETEG